MPKSIFMLLSQSVIFNATCKEKFGAAAKVRDLNLFSLLFLNLGYVRVYFFSIEKPLSKANFKIVRILKFSSVQKWPTESTLVGVMIRNEDKFTSENLPHIEYKLTQESDRFNLSMGKIPNYISVVVFVIPFYYGIFMLFPKSILVMTITGFACNYLLACTTLICKTLSVKNCSRSTFADIIDHPAKAKYYDWQMMKRENDFIVGLVKNIERSLFSSIVIAILAGTIGLMLKNIESPSRSLGADTQSIRTSVIVSKNARKAAIIQQSPPSPHPKNLQKGDKEKFDQNQINLGANNAIASNVPPHIAKDEIKPCVQKSKNTDHQSLSSPIDSFMMK